MPSFDWEIANRYRNRLKSQTKHQRVHRKKLKASKLPERDDVAKHVLLLTLDSMKCKPAVAEKWLAEMGNRLEVAGFDREGSIERLRGMAARHEQKLAK